MKRSTQVALLVMGVAGVGASAYAFTSAKRDCVAPRATPQAAAAAVDKDSKLEPCPPRRSYSNAGYYRSHWYSSGPSHWSTPIFARRLPANATSVPPSNSSTSLGFTNRPSTTSTTSRPSTSTTTTRTGFGTIGHSVSSHSTSS